MKIKVEICRNCRHLQTLEHFLPNKKPVTEYGCPLIHFFLCEEDFVRCNVPEDCELKAEYFIRDCNEEES